MTDQTLSRSASTQNAITPDVPSFVGAWVMPVEVMLTTVVELSVAILVAVEVLVLFGGIVARYVLLSPLLWSDELASILFLWLAMLGSAVAFHRGEHMRMTALVNMMPPVVAAFLELFATAAALTFLIIILPSSFDLVFEESYILTPALEIPNSWRAAALPVGAVLMVIFGLLRLMKTSDVAMTALTLGATVATVIAFVLLQPMFANLGSFNLLVFFVGVVAMTVLAGVPIAFAFGLATIGYVALATHAPMLVVVGRINEGMSHLILLAVPLFIFLGMLIEMTGMAQAMVRFLASMLGHVRGGLSYVLVGAMYLVSGISGAKAADMAAVAPVLFPEMKARGAKPGDLVALLSATGAQTETVPPSLVLITIGSVTGVSISALFTGGLLPGLVLGVTLCIMVGWRYRNEDLSNVRRPSRAEIWRCFLVAIPALALPILIRAAVVEGVATATEVSTIGILYSAIAGLFLYRRFAWSRLIPMLVESGALSGSILLIIGAATAMAWGLTQSGFSQTLATTMASLPGGGTTFIIVSILAFVILGSVLEGIPAIVLFGPLLFPIARNLGIHEVHYAMVVILAMGLGLFAPPFGVGYYAACAIGRVKPDEGMRPIWGYLFALLIGLILVAAVPWISTGFL
ncbi:TRAP transporter large permease [Bradyrhizobium sp.]|uniref:TRAP transporter large permease n=1 Tax=Bradyrhizobium sp. TaxID=376 RepID=UPI004037F601